MGRKAIKVVFLVFVSLSLIGCAGSRGMIKVTEIEPLTTPVCDQLDEYVTNDTNMEQREKDRWLRSTDILRKVMEKAMEGISEQ